jgi:hypothetical protein
VLVLGITIMLAVISVAAFPCWAYSARWGFTPSTIAGALLLCVAVGVSSKHASKAVEPGLAMATTSQPAGAVPAVARLGAEFSAPNGASP